MAKRFGNGVVVRIGAAYDQIIVPTGTEYVAVIDRAELRKQGKRGHQIIRQAEKSISKPYA